ncbi:hypothetical protein [Roseimicrobium sp. ORNL1]|uniref:hypothetical protein n=1 Tax=Roseimicrobium sp. ORNL1 TaxID=2711231 RepID=UPI0013E15BC2|nr:hypothetical protein [Roseimicrobium sp. ORNL1]QIF04770.1 hypothetical protein G5S37_25725 [Roseimicrobium sp. ORNL1]
MSLSSRITTVACRLGLVLALSAPVSFVAAQSSASPSAAKPKTKLAPRPLPGSTSRSNQSGPSDDDLATAEAQNRSKVPLYRPSSVQPRSGTAGETSANQQAAMQHSDRAKIVAIRRRGTFPVPTSIPSDTAPALVNETGPSTVAAEPAPAALPPGKIRIIPKEMIKASTPAAPHP